MITRMLPAALLTLSLSACASIEMPFVKQSVPLPDGYAFASFQADGATGVRRNDSWWTSLNDPLLNRLVEDGLAQNLDVQVSLARLQAARAALGTTGIAAQTRGGLDFSIRRGMQNNGDWSTNSITAFDPSFIIDLFGQERMRQDRARAELRAAEFDTAAARLAFQLDITRAYLDARYLSTALEIMRSSRDNRARYLQLVEQQADVGVASERDIQRATTSLLSVRLELTDLELAQSQAALRLATLVAVSPSEMLALLRNNPGPQPRPTSDIDVSPPAQLLRNRPDILAAEARLQSAVANFGVTAADLLPALQLSGVVRISTTNLVELGPSIRLPILSQRLREARKDEAMARVEEADLLWQRSIRNAIEEVELGLSRAEQASRKRGIALRFLTSSEEGLRLNTASFQLGNSSLTELLDAERDVADARMQLALATRDFAAAWAQLQIAIGHGWHGIYRVDRCCIDGEPYEVAAEEDTE